MGFELTQSAVFYIILMAVVIFLGLAIVAGGNPIILFKQQQFAGLFEPGRVIPKSDMDPYVSLQCSGNPDKIIIKNAAFMYKGKPGDKEGSVDFIVILDYYNLYLGVDENSGVKKISCSASPSDEASDCPPVTMEFDMKQPIDKGNQVFHFTVWKSNQALIDAAAPDNRINMATLLDTYSAYYVSSFDVNKNVDDACAQSNCNAITDKGSCISGCYWTENWWDDKCNACPTYGECSKYSKEQCAQCSAAQANCKVGWFGCEAN